jgi:hypothetical protein
MWEEEKSRRCSVGLMDGDARLLDAGDLSGIGEAVRDQRIDLVDAGKIDTTAHTELGVIGEQVRAISAGDQTAFHGGKSIGGFGQAKVSVNPSARQEETMDVVVVKHLFGQSAAE